MTDKADICLILENSYPFVYDNVSPLIHSLITTHKNLSFSILSVTSNKEKMKYTLPDNVIEMKEIILSDKTKGSLFFFGEELNKTIAELFILFKKIEQGKASEEDFFEVYKLVKKYKGKLGSRHFSSRKVWNNITNMYNEVALGASFADYFATFKNFAENIVDILAFEVPKAKIYHTFSTGYAGLLAFNAKLSSEAFVMITEQDIYTNLKRIEILRADWFSEKMKKDFVIGKKRTTIKDIWVNYFEAFAKTCYSACDQIITLFKSNQEFQIADGANPDKLRIIPNGIDYDRFSNLERTPIEGRELCVMMAAKIVPINDIKTFLRSCAIVVKYMPFVKFVIIGDTEEDKTYYKECLDMVSHYNLDRNISFYGKETDVIQNLKGADLLVLTSVFATEPLILLEAGAMKIPFVSTDVGMVKEIAFGKSYDIQDVAIGQGGIITPLSSPNDTAKAIVSLLSNYEARKKYGKSLQERVKKYYNKANIDKIYAEIYKQALKG